MSVTASVPRPVPGVIFLVIPVCVCLRSIWRVKLFPIDFTFMLCFYTYLMLLEGWVFTLLNKAMWYDWKWDTYSKQSPNKSDDRETFSKNQTQYHKLSRPLKSQHDKMRNYWLVNEKEKSNSDERKTLSKDQTQYHKVGY